MTFRLLIVVCSMLNGETECRYVESPQPYLSLKSCEDAALRELIRWWKCVKRTGEESA